MAAKTLTASAGSRHAPGHAAVGVLVAAVLEEFLARFRLAVAERRLVKLTLSAPRASEATLRRVAVRLVELRAGWQLSFCYRHRTRDLTKNFPLEAGAAEVGRLLGQAFGNAHLFTAEVEAELLWPVTGKPVLRSRPAKHGGAVSTSHDRQKARFIEVTTPWLQSLGVTTPESRVRADQAAKFRQINRFVEILGHSLGGPELTRLRVSGADQEVAAGAAPSNTSPFGDGPRLAQALEETGVSRSPRAVRVVDMGCGKGYLTFAAHAWLQRHGWPAEVRGIEARPDLVAFCNQVAAKHSCEGLVFQQGSIAESPFEPVDILVALHACDTATDDAIAQGVRAGAALIMVAPCCHKELRPQLRPSPPLDLVFRHGIFREREAELVTDALRAALLEWAGYAARVFEFIATEHTAKNLMIVGTRRSSRGNREACAEHIRALARTYGVGSQRLAGRLGFRLAGPVPSRSGEVIE